MCFDMQRQRGLAPRWDTHAAQEDTKGLVPQL